MNHINLSVFSQLKKAMMTPFISLVFLLLFLVGCKNKDDGTSGLITYGFEQATADIQENSTTPLIVKITLSRAPTSALRIPIIVSGTAVADTNYIFTDKEINIQAGANEASLTITPKNNRELEGDKTLIIVLSTVSGYRVTSGKTVFTATIIDNIPIPSLSFTKGTITSNPYLGETIDVSIGLKESFETPITVPIATSGSATTDNYEVMGLADNKITILANTLQATFQVKLKSIGSFAIPKTIIFTIEDGDYTVEEDKKSATITLVDPVVENIWFIDKSTLLDNNGNQYIQPSLMNDERQYDNAKEAINVLTEGVYQVSGQYENKAMEWKNDIGTILLSSNQIDPNLLQASWQVIFKTPPPPNNIGTQNDYIKYETLGTTDPYGLTKFMKKDYIVGYPNALAKVDQYLRFAPTTNEGTTGKVIVPEQTITFYKVKAGINWTEEMDATANNIEGKSISYDGITKYMDECEGTECEAGEKYEGGKTESQIPFHNIDANENMGDISKSSNVEPVTITIKGEGTFDIASKKIEITLDYETMDANLFDETLLPDGSSATKGTIMYRIYPLEADLPK